MAESHQPDGEPAGCRTVSGKLNTLTVAFVIDSVESTMMTFSRRAEGPDHAGITGEFSGI